MLASQQLIWLLLVNPVQTLALWAAVVTLTPLFFNAHGSMKAFDEAHTMIADRKSNVLACITGKSLKITAATLIFACSRCRTVFCVDVGKLHDLGLHPCGAGAHFELS